MSSRTKQIGFAAAVAMLVALMGQPTAQANDADRHQANANGSYRPQPSQNEQTGMSWLEYFTCVKTVQSQMGSWTYATQQCEDQKPNDPPEPPVRMTEDRKAPASTPSASAPRGDK